MWAGNGGSSILFAVGMGTIGLPIAQTLTLHQPSWKRTIIAIPLIYGSWYFLTILVSRWNPKGPIEDFVNFVSIWQATYLLFMFAPWPKRLTRAPHP